jgi:uncharacterized protein YabE (DUF348 family)
MKRKTKIILFISLPVIGVIAGYLLMGRTVNISLNGTEQQIHTRAMTVSGALRNAGISVDPADQVTPPLDGWLSRVDMIEVNSSRTIRVLVEPDSDILVVESASRTAREILTQAGVNLDQPGVALVDGIPTSLNTPIEQRGEIVLQYRPSVNLTILMDGDERTITSSAPDLRTALWQAGIILREGDRLSVSPDTALTADLTVEITSGKPLLISVDGATLTGYSASNTIGEALAENGVALQDLDYSQPALSDPLPEDGVIKVIRVTEELLMQQATIPYQTELLADDNLELGAREVVTEGAVGISADRVLVRYEDGEEVSRVNEGSIVIAEPVTRVVNYGSKIVDKYLDTPDGPITYYFTANVTATSYSPCRSGVEGVCYTGTSYGLPVKKGVIGVHRSWYYMFRGTQIYVPGYGVGTIADIGYYPYNDNWIDLGYSDDDYVSWGATNLTIYFLSPPPAGFTGVLP